LNSEDEKESLIYLRRAIDLKPGFIDQDQLDQDFGALSGNSKFEVLRQSVQSGN